MRDTHELKVGDTLPAFVAGPISRRDLALFAGASGDHNSLHIDIDAARAAGMADVFAQGMLPMAYLAKCLTDWMPQRRLRSYGVRFVAMTLLRERITCTGTVAEIIDMAGTPYARLAITAANEAGEIKLSGEAVVALK